MKNFTLLLMTLFISSLAFSQVFNWELHDLGTKNNLQKMSINGTEAVIAGFNNTFIKTTDNGDTWNSVGVIRPVFDYYDLSVKGDIGYFVGGREKLYDANPDVYANGVIYKTTDGGTTWSEVELDGLGEGNDPAIDPNALLAYGYDFKSVECVNDSIAFCGLKWYEYGDGNHSGVLKTTDGGASWENISGDFGGSSLEVIAAGTDVVYFGGSNVLMKVPLGGGTATDLIANLVADSKAFVTDIAVVNDTTIYVSTSIDGAFMSTDGGTTFTKYDALGANGGWDILPINDSTIVFVGGKGKSRVSYDNGTSWVDCLLSTPTIWDIVGIFNDSLVVLSTDDIYKIAMTDLLARNYNWITQTIGDGILNKAHIFDANTMMIVGRDGIAKVTSDLGVTWTDVTLPYIAGWDDGIDFNGLSSKGDVGFACFNRFKLFDYPSGTEDIYYSGGILVTDDNWETWDDLDMAKIGKADAADVAKNPNHDNCNGLNPQVVKYMGGDTLLLWARWNDISVSPKVEYSCIFKTVDGGNNWYVVSTEFGRNLYVQDIEFDGNVGYAAGKEILRKSIDGGETFTDIYANLDEGEDDGMFIYDVTLGSPDELFVTTSGDGIWKSTDAGNTFSKFDGPVGSYDFYKFDSNSYMALGLTSKSYFSNDKGATWESCAAPAHCYEIGGILDGKLFGLSQGKFYTLPVEDLDLQTGIATTLLSNKLSVLYGTRSITLTSNNTIDKCWVYNLSGQLMSIKVPNSNICEFNNSSFSSGVYIITSSVKGQKFTNKVVFK